MRRRVSAGLVLALLCVGLLSLSLDVERGVRGQEISAGPYVDQLTFFATTDESRALGDISVGQTDLYLWRVPMLLREQARADPNITLVNGVGGDLSLVFNPAPTDAFNPFCLKVVRQAMQYLIDRAYIINAVHKGDASPKIFFFGRYDPDYAYVENLGETLLSEHNYNFEIANQLVSTALTTAGAIRGEDGNWTKNGVPITINGFIRSDDPIRKTIGDLLAADLEKLGLRVNRNYGDLNRAFYDVYGSDPADGVWHFYTEGWRTGALTKYDSGGLPQMYAPFFGNMPGWQEPGYWQYENSTINDLAQKYSSGDFTSLDERGSIIRQILEMAFDESVRLFIVDQLEPYPSNSRFSPFVTELNRGSATPFTFYTIRLPEGDPARRPDGTGGSLKVAQKLMYQGAYNPIGGFTDAYSVNIWNIVSDPGLWPDPHTGAYMPVRTPYEVNTAGPSSKFNVPADAETWDTLDHKWKTVGSGTQAASSVTFNMNMSNWHYGIPMTPADIRYAIYMSLEWSTQGIEGASDPRYDSYYSGIQTAWVDAFRGFKFIDDDTVQVYVDYWFPDDTEIAAFASIWPKLPWEVLYITESVVMAKAAGYSRAASNAIGKPWLDLTAPAAGLPEMKANLTAWGGSALPIAGADSGGQPLPYFDAGNRTMRYNTLQVWVTAHNHLLVSNGPFYFDSTDRVAGQDTLKAFRDPTYPFSPHYWTDKLRLHASFSYTPPLPDLQENITFDASASYDLLGGIANYFWDFGDGTTQSGQNPIVTHAYTRYGIYDVVLTVSSSDGLTDSCERHVVAGTPPLRPFALFSFSPSAPIMSETIAFNASAGFDLDGYIVNYIWDFGDQTTTVETDPIATHTYMNAGAFTVTLTVVDNDGANGTIAQMINVGKTQAVVSVSTESKSTFAGFTVDVVGRLANLHDGSLENRTIVVSYSVQGTGQWIPLASDMTDNLGRYRIVWIPTAMGYFLLKADWAGDADYLSTFVVTSLSSLLFEQRVFTVESNSTISELAFDAENWELRFDTTGQGGAIGFFKVTVAKSLVANPADIEVNVDGALIEFAIASLDDSWLLTFTCAHSTHQVIVGLPKTISDVTAPVASAGIDQTINEDTVVTFDGSVSTDNVAVTAYTWAFTDITARTLTGEKPTYTFSMPGVYTITLNVTDATGNWAIDTVVITVLDITKPVAEVGQDRSIWAGATVSFDAGVSSDNVGIVAYEWAFGDGSTGTGKTTTHTYTSPGTYTVTLTVKDAANNNATEMVTVTVLSTPPPEMIPLWMVGAVVGVVAGAAVAILVLRRRK